MRHNGREWSEAPEVNNSLNNSIVQLNDKEDGIEATINRSLATGVGEISHNYSSEELKPCPFCGGEPTRLFDSRNTFEEHSITCTQCIASIACITDEQAVRAWNHRETKCC